MYVCMYVCICAHVRAKGSPICAFGSCLTGSDVCMYVFMYVYVHDVCSSYMCKMYILLHAAFRFFFLNLHVHVSTYASSTFLSHLYFYETNIHNIHIIDNLYN